MLLEKTIDTWNAVSKGAAVVVIGNSSTRKSGFRRVLTLKDDATIFSSELNQCIKLSRNMLRREKTKIMYFPIIW